MHLSVPAICSFNLQTQNSEFDLNDQGQFKTFWTPPARFCDFTGRQCHGKMAPFLLIMLLMEVDAGAPSSLRGPLTAVGAARP